MAEKLKKRGDFPFDLAGKGSRQWDAYQKEHGLGRHAGGGQTKEGYVPPSESVTVGPGATGESAGGSAGKTQTEKREAALRARGLTAEEAAKLLRKQKQ